MSAPLDREEWLRQRAREIRAKHGVPEPAPRPAPVVVDAPPLEIAQPSPYSEGAPLVDTPDLSAVADADLVRELARRLAR